jgi:tetratricopeptide (TPR) repeat protein
MQLADFMRARLLCGAFAGIACGLPFMHAQVDSSRSSMTSTKEVQSLIVEANAARDAQQLDKAVLLYRQALALQPAWTEGWWSLGTIYYDADNYADAANAFSKVVAQDYRQGTARAMLGLCEFELGQEVEALRDIEASKSLGVIEDAQLRQVVLFHEGLLLQRASRFEGAQKALSSLCLSGIRGDEVQQTFGMVVLRMPDKKPPAAGSEDAEVVEHLGRGACLSGQKNYEAARPEYAFVIKNYPQHRYVHYAYGRFLLDARDLTAAIEEFQQEIKADPNSVLARLQIAAAEYKVNAAAGLPYAEEAVRLAPDQPFAHYLLGLLLLDNGDYQAAIPPLEIAQKAFPKETKVYWSLGVAYAHVGRAQDAARARANVARLNQAAEETGEAKSGESAEPGSQIEMTDKLDGSSRP